MRSTTTRGAVPALLSAMLLCAATSAGAQGLSSGTGTGGSISQGAQPAGRPALQAPASPQTQPQGATPTPSARNPLPGQGAVGSPVVPPLNSTGAGAIVPPGNLPTRSSSAAEAFSMLDRGQVGYVTRADTDRIPGFMGFDNADTNRDGQLSREEFVNAWRGYSGQ